MAISEKDVIRLQQNLSTIRNLGGWSIREFADMCKVSPQTISNWESKDSKNPINLGNYWLIVAALGTEMSKRGDDDIFTKLVSYILSGDTNEQQYEENTKKIATLGQTAKGGASSEVISGLVGALGVTLPMVAPVVIGGAIGALMSHLLLEKE